MSNENEEPQVVVISVLEIRRRELLIEIIRKGKHELPSVRIDGIEYRCGTGDEYPRTVTRIDIRMRFCGWKTVYSHPVPRPGETFRSKPIVFNTTIEVKSNLAREVRMLTFEEVACLKVGDELILKGKYQHPARPRDVFAWQSDCSISDGRTHIRAYYDRHRSGHFLGYEPTFEPMYWLLFLAAYVGHTDQEIYDEGADELCKRVIVLREQALKTPFAKRNDGSVSNGWMYFLPKRPTAQEWLAAELKHVRFASVITEQNWKEFLRVIIGMTYDGFRDIKRFQKTLGRTSEGPAVSPLPGLCVDASFFDEEVGRIMFGERFVFSGKKNGIEIFFVDKPEYGVGLYIFRERQDAMAWAEGTISVQEARKRGRFIPHRKGWEHRVKSHITSICGE